MCQEFLFPCQRNLHRSALTSGVHGQHGLKIRISKIRTTLPRVWRATEQEKKMGIIF
jgi:hypothetical protein